jgi:hypothetical protein
MVESQFSAVDVLIYLGLAVAGGLGGAVACSSGDATAQASCASVGSSLVPFLIASRTVSYQCVGSERTTQSLDPVQTFPAAHVK